MRFSLKVSMSIQALSEASFYKKALSWVLSYGIIFSYPGWVYFNQVAHAGTGAPKNPNGGIVEPQAGTSAKAPVTTVQPTPPPPPSGDGKGHVPVTGAYDPSRNTPSRALEDIAKSCAPTAYLETHFKAGGDLFKNDICVSLKADTPKEVVVECIYQMRLAMSGYQVNQFMLGQDAMEAGQAAGRATDAADLELQNIFHQPPLYTNDDYNAVFRNKEKFGKVAQSFANDAKNKSPADRARCCIDLANHAQKIAQVLNQNKKIPEIFAEDYSDRVFLEEKQKCGGEQTGDGGKAPVAVVGGHGKNPGLPVSPPPPPPAPEKKKNNTLLAVLFGIGVAVLAAVLINKKSKKNKNKKKHKKHKKKKKEPVDPGCGESGCSASTGEGTTTGATTEGTSTGTSTGETSTGGTSTGATTAGTNTYSDGDNMLRPVSTGGTGSDGYSDDDNRGRGSSTGATGGSITGSTTAGETTGSNGGATDGGDTFSPGDNPADRVFDGDVRLAPQSQNSKTLIKNKPTKN